MTLDETTLTRPEGDRPGGFRVDHEAVLVEVRRRLAAGEHFSGPLATSFYRAVDALDPTATEETLGALPGNAGVQLYENLIAWAPVRTGEVVIDVGCGSGGSTRAAAAAVGAHGRVIGVDPIAEALVAARSRTPQKLPVEYRRLSGEHLTGIGDRSADGAVLSLVLEQVDDMAALLGEVARVLRPGGRLVASVMAWDRLRPVDHGLWGSVLAVVARHAPGALVGRASRASIPHEPEDAAAFVHAGLLVPEERDVQLAVVMETVEDAWAFFSRTYLFHMLDAEGRGDLRAALARRVPHTLSLPIRFLRTRRPG
ncbi:MAG: methyltransferase domain-containing protein [Actinomycetota bacterium]